MKALKDIRVLDFSTLLPGPLTTLMLVDAGAEVIKVEKIGGEDLRRSKPFVKGHSLLFSILNRGKKSIELDLKKKENKEKILKLVKTADVVVEQFRPGVMKRLGLDWKTLKKINTKLVYCSISGYGQTGRKKLIAGHDLNYMAESGLLSLSTSKDGTPIIPNTQIADIAGGSYPAFMNIVLGLIKAFKTQQGSYIDISMYENLIPLAWLGLSHYFKEKESPKKNTLHLNGGYHRYFIYETYDKKFLALGALEDKFWYKFCEIIKAPKDILLEKEKNFIIIEKVQNIIKTKTGKYWKRKFSDEKNVCCTLVEKVENLIYDPHLKEKKVLTERKGLLAKIPTVINDKKLINKNKQKAPLLAEHNYIINDL
ncbi:MAG: Acetyl-CoA:oxalate CoA-transferase [Alphaproteobacteria bacterium MarineAlpha9_Bin4]|nr:MAG: Acetyl-CoA:oxalate CoA-transferase [Alphaproteobacteria bacterium MarineAlpha9_Bin4]|tara:strand:+ start:2700 stop:3803 length:1104 start_codon:yes stop_codon:yes gene_type:complete